MSSIKADIKFIVNVCFLLPWFLVSLLAFSYPCVFSFSELRNSNSEIYHREIIRLISTHWILHDYSCDYFNIRLLNFLHFIQSKYIPSITTQRSPGTAAIRRRDVIPEWLKSIWETLRVPNNSMGLEIPLFLYIKKENTSERDGGERGVKRIKGRDQTASQGMAK